ncbi:MAG: beta-ketoacyl-ACP synthase II [Bacteroidetes bacterium]|nr:beta-ketoacyl-ACP synthase II [Bacteroidota bacterium]
MELKRSVITGLGTINGSGGTVQEFWKNLVKGVSASRLITLFDMSRFKTRFACEVNGYDPNDYFEKKEARKLDRFAQFAMIAADQALEDAQFDLKSIDLDRAGVIFGSGIGGLETFQNELKNYFSGDGTPRFSPFFIPKMIADISAGLISMKYNFRGPNFATVSACATSSHAIIDAYNYIRLGIADVFITGGSEASITEAGIGGFNAMHAMSTNNEEYETASRPFCATRDGFVMGEGGGALILEEMNHAVRRGARIYGEIMGAGLSADAHHLTAPHPEGLGAYKVMCNALEDAKMNPEDIDYINVHGTATPLGDISETLAIKNVFGEHAYNLNISSTKSMTGHLLGAAGAVEAIAAILSVRDGIVPPTINHRKIDPQIDTRLNLTLHKAQKRTVRAALSNTFGFGGHNASIIFSNFSG